MKTIKFFLLSAILAFKYADSTAQHIYTHGVDAVSTDITYEVRVSPYTFYLKNAANELINQPITWADGTELTEDEYETLVLGTIKTGGFRKVIQETFSETECEMLKSGKDYMDLFTVIDANGRILELVFYVHKSPRTEAISPEKFALLEQNLKKHVVYSITEDMQKISFWRSFHRINFAVLGAYFKNPYAETLPDSLQINP